MSEILKPLQEDIYDKILNKEPKRNDIYSNQIGYAEVFITGED
jgi:hypothetical protein